MPRTTDTPTGSAAELVAGCLAGSQRAWAALVERYSPLVWTVARSHRLSPADCEEVYQLTWLRVYQSMARLHSPHRFAAWITTCARRESLKQCRSTGRYVPVGDGSFFDRPATGNGPETAVLSGERRSEVLAALSQLPSRDRALLTLLSADPAPGYDEVSRTLGIARGSVGPLRGRALRRLAERLEAQGVLTAADA
ncbi:RNA polymerase sigma factor [Streptomyces spinosisporus]|uniref:Sigma-70 family RNA polymerase sigma factor n=1 Tax=Streptomyces spinosisporus TaxID=2927582 RepID=A0ABS9XGS5_9ACTN|nr:sigma-70 family RNA polymerase sigma factor [Streptomyces spinosisporus]MCI3240102.1 sigma-70 family RNA polymerase sigma factor [Streptomyces spinosisporus]